MATDDVMGVPAEAVAEDETAKRRRILYPMYPAVRFKFQSLGRDPHGRFYPALNILLHGNGTVQVGDSVCHGSWAVIGEDEMEIHFHYKGTVKVKEHRFKKVAETHGYICINAGVGWESVLFPADISGLQLQQ